MTPSAARSSRPRRLRPTYARWPVTRPRRPARSASSSLSVPRLRVSTPSCSIAAATSTTAGLRRWPKVPARAVWSCDGSDPTTHVRTEAKDSLMVAQQRTTAGAPAGGGERRDRRERDNRRGDVPEKSAFVERVAVSYTHLTLPTIYSV